jgi:hypothetical protein
MESMIALQSGRLDRRVRRSFLRINEGDSRHRIAYSIEEALRLAHLPGEDEGRIYCFRRISLAGIPAESNRRVWMEAVQKALAGLAAQAVHASHSDAGVCNAVFFNHREEAMEFLLSGAVRALRLPAAPSPPWYASSVLGIAESTSYREFIPVLIAQICGVAGFTPAGPAILFAVLKDDDPEPLLSSIPAETFREWLRALEGSPSASGESDPPYLPEKFLRAIRNAAASFGWKDPGTIWLASQAVLCVAPSALRFATVLRHARAVLRALEAESRHEVADQGGPQIRAGARVSLVFDNDDGPIADLNDARKGGSASPAGISELPAANLSAAAPVRSAAASPSPATSRFEVRRSIRIFDDIDSPRPLLGEPTAAAGLYFLINALERVGIAAAIDACPVLREASFSLHLLKRLAMDARIDEDDPILRCLPPRDQPLHLEDEGWAEIKSKTECRPRGLTAVAPRDPATLVRLWAVAARRWCWQVARLGLGEIVHRPGRVWLTRTDLDVTLPLDQAEIRIRRAGLDIDPGYISWFGPWGLVVRFHYREGDFPLRDDAEPGARP